MTRLVRVEEPGPGVNDRRDPTLNDAEIFVAMRSGNLTALGVLYDRHQAGVRGFLVRARPGGVDAEDILHEVFLAAGRVASTYDGRADARPFLLGIASNMVRSRREKEASWSRAFARVEATITSVFRRTPEDAASETQQMHLLNAGLARLSEEKRLVLLLIELEGLSGDDVASTLGIPVATVWTRLHYARAELREHMKRRM